MKVTKLVLPVAGLGKRLRPLTRNRPKALVPLNGGPLLDYVLHEAQESGIREVILIVSPQHIPHFRKYLVKNRHRFKNLRFHVRVQEKPLGNGHAVIQASDVIGKDPFAVRFCDDLLLCKPPALHHLLSFYERYRAPILLLERVPRKLVSRYGVVDIRATHRKMHGSARGRVYEIRDIVEKPKPAAAPSNLTIVGGYVLTPNILRNLKKIAASLPAAANDALPIAVSFQVELITGGKLYGWEFFGTRLDCGTLEGFKKAEAFLAKAAK